MWIKANDNVEVICGEDRGTRSKVIRVMLVCGSCGAATRVGARRLADGSKERYCKKCGAGNGIVAPVKARFAKK
jgi:ribosomal protein L24